MIDNVKIKRTIVYEQTVSVKEYDVEEELGEEASDEDILEFIKEVEQDNFDGEIPESAKIITDVEVI